MRRVRAEVLNARRIGAYHSITIVAPEVAEKVRPGQFVSVAMPTGRTFLLRRQFSIHQASRRRNVGSRSVVPRTGQAT